MSWMIIRSTLASIEPLPDGLLITKVNQLRVQTAEWTLLVIIDAPELDPKLLQNIDMIMVQAEQALIKGIIPHVQYRSWLLRLQSIKSYILNHRMVSSATSEHTREKRGLIDFVGQVGHTLFGLATDDSIEECHRVIENTRRYQKMIVHQVNQLTTVLNRTQGAVAKNRYQINKVTAFISGALLPSINHAFVQLNNTNMRLFRLEKAFYFDKTVSLLEQVTSSYMQAVQKYSRQKASLEIGRLTEDIFSMAHLADVLRKATTGTTFPVQPLQWYYEHAHVFPVWGKDTLIYRVKLPLVNEKTYHRYNIVTWPVPYAERGYSIKILVDHVDIGLDTTNGDIFHPVGCMGYRPMICRTGALYNVREWNCPRTLIAGNKRGHNCQVAITKGNNGTKITEISYGEYVIVTFGEVVETRCSGKAGIREQLVAGTYLIRVSPRCVVMGNSWTMTGLIERVGHTSVAALWVKSPILLNITDIIPQNQAIKLLDKTPFAKLSAVARIDLAPIEEPPTTIDWTYHGSRMSFGLLILFIVLGVWLFLGSCILWTKRSQILNFVQGGWKGVNHDKLHSRKFDTASQNSEVPMEDEYLTILDMEDNKPDIKSSVKSYKKPSSSVFHFTAK